MNKEHPLHLGKTAVPVDVIHIRITLDRWVGKGTVNGLQLASSVLGFVSFAQVSVLY